MIELSLPGMTCNGCLRGVTATIHDLDPKAVIEADLANRSAKITSTASEASLRAALTEAGFMD